MDDLLGRARDVEENAKDAVADVTDDEDSDDEDSADVAALRASLAELQAKVEQLTALQGKTNKS